VPALFQDARQARTGRHDQANWTAAVGTRRAGFDDDIEIGGHGHAITCAQTAARAQERDPPRAFDWPDKQDLGNAATGSLTQQASGENSAPVDDQQIAGLEQLWQVLELVMLHTAARAMDAQEPRCLAIGERDLRDELGRERVVEGLDGRVSGRRRGEGSW
jgi:hypothetical protein